MDPQKEQVCFIQFDPRGYPHEVLTRYWVSRTAPGVEPYWRAVSYDFEYSTAQKKTLYQEYGSSSLDSCELAQFVYPSRNPIKASHYWALPDIEIIVPDGVEAVRLELPEQYPQDLFEEAIECEYGMIFCTRCNSWYDGDLYQNAGPCSHCWWCDHHGQWSVPGERCIHIHRLVPRWHKKTRLERYVGRLMVPFISYYQEGIVRQNKTRLSMITSKGADQNVQSRNDQSPLPHL